MSFFQATVTKKYANTLDKELVKKAYANFKAHFHNLGIQENIRNSKEEQYQEGFFRDLFVNVLGYRLNPEPNYNLITENKNVTGSKKSDGAIIINGNVCGVIELKGTDTTDLSKIEVQAFGYKNNQLNCSYVVTSNFEKLWFYIDNAIEHLEFNLFTLSETDFELLYLCLSFSSLIDDIPKKIKAESLSEEDTITKKLYKDYSLFKRELHQNLVELNPDFDALTLFKKSQKLLDRFLFLFFSEDRNLLPPNSVRLVLNDWRDLQERDEYTPLYSRFKKYFGYLNTGFKGKRYDVFAYNGGLFKPDELLDSIQIDDELLFKHTKKLSEYNFESEVDVNILGHIFENSLNELDEIQAQLEGQAIEKAKTKRKKDGVFYTPKYITKYIVENTVGKLCTDKKLALDLKDEDFNKKTGKAREPYFEKLKVYRNWLLELTICDPACGSGAFLNQALDFLINEHKYLDELQAKLFGDALLLNDVSKNILENNLFGVDLNEESVEIAKLSLWLRTAQPNRKLNDLNNNIKCGNSLIDDPEIAGDKAFNWPLEFPQVFEKGGFDVIIGNPPYLNLTKGNTTENILDYFIDKFESIKTANSKNLFTLFNESSLSLSKENGLISFIIPEGFLKTRSYDDCVKVMNNNGKIFKAIYFEDWVFEDATTGSVIFEFVKNKDYNNDLENYLIKKNKELVKIENKINLVIEKYNHLPFPIILDLCDTFKGMAVQNRQDYIFNEKQNLPNMFLLGNCIDRYLFKDSFYCDYTKLTIVGGTKNKGKHDISPRILIRRTGNFLCCVMLNEPALTESTLYSCSIKSDDLDSYYLLSILNSKLLTYIVRQNMITNEQAFPQILMTDIQLLKIPLIDKTQQKVLGEKSKIIENLYKNLQEHSQKFQRTIQRKFELTELSNKLENWYSITYKEFIAELAKKKIKLSLTDEAEWEEYFLAESQKAQAIKVEIDQTDKEIDAMVYQLYGLTEEEIKIVEGK